MSSAIGIQLTEEQKEFLISLEEEFKDRYTDKDEEFNAVMKRSLPPPPIVTNWRDFRHRDDRRNSYRYERDQDWVQGQDRFRSPVRFPHQDDRRRDGYYRGNGDRYSHSSRDDYRYSHSSRDDYRYSHSSRDDYRYSHSSRDDYHRYGQRNHADSYRP